MLESGNTIKNKSQGKDIQRFGTLEYIVILNISVMTGLIEKTRFEQNNEKEMQNSSKSF